MLDCNTIYETSKNTLWIHIIDSTFELETRLDNCKLYVFVMRLQLYLARYHKRSAYDVKISIQQMRADLRIQEDFVIRKELIHLSDMLDEKVENLMRELYSDIEFDWVGLKVPVEDVSTPIEDPAGTDCVVCHAELTPPGVRTKPCEHVYCRACLETWIHAAQNASHTCGYCRTELFPEPDYQIKDPEVEREYQARFDVLQRQREGLATLISSLKWFSKEMVLQQTFEEEVTLLTNIARYEQMPTEEPNPYRLAPIIFRPDP